MCDFNESSQLHEWMFSSHALLQQCRTKGNLTAREFLAQPSSSSNNNNNNKEDTTKDSNSNNNNDTNTTATTTTTNTTTTTTATTSNSSLPPVYNFASGYDRQHKDAPTVDFTAQGPWTNASDHAFLAPDEEELLVAFYASKLPSLIGPLAQVPRLRRESKVTATAAAFLRRFYLSNSVMIHDPKAVMVAAAFLATKVEDATADIRYLEDGTNLMNAPVTMSEILPAELALMEGISFQLLCFHPFKPVVALTEDLRTFLKSDKGMTLVQNKRIAGEDLKPLYDGARAVLDDVIVSDIPLLYTPGQIGLGALMVANEDLQTKQQQQQQQQQQQLDNMNNDKEPTDTVSNDEGGLPTLDILGYIRLRFSEERGKEMEGIMKDLLPMLRGLREGKYGCGHHNVDMVKLKGVHKKLKKCRAWGKMKKSKKRGADGGGDDEPKSKKSKSS